MTDQNIEILMADQTHIDELCELMLSWCAEKGLNTDIEKIRKTVISHLSTGNVIIGKVGGKVAGLMSFFISENFYDDSKWLMEKGFFILNSVRGTYFFKKIYNSFIGFGRLNNCTHVVLVPNKMFSSNFEKLVSKNEENGFKVYAYGMIKEI